MLKVALCCQVCAGCVLQNAGCSYASVFALLVAEGINSFLPPCDLQSNLALRRFMHCPLGGSWHLKTSFVSCKDRPMAKAILVLHLTYGQLGCIMPSHRSRGINLIHWLRCTHCYNMLWSKCSNPGPWALSDRMSSQPIKNYKVTSITNHTTKGQHHT